MLYRHCIEDFVQGGAGGTVEAGEEKGRIPYSSRIKWYPNYHRAAHHNALVL